MRDDLNPKSLPRNQFPSQVPEDIMTCLLVIGRFILIGLILISAMCATWMRYCECFASGIYCDGCNCVNCFNNVENEAARRETVEATLERNPNAFRPKVVSNPHGTCDRRDVDSEIAVHLKRLCRKDPTTKGLLVKSTIGVCCGSCCLKILWCGYDNLEGMVF